MIRTIFFVLFAFLTYGCLFSSFSSGVADAFVVVSPLGINTIHNNAENILLLPPKKRRPSSSASSSSVLQRRQHNMVPLLYGDDLSMMLPSMISLYQSNLMDYPMVTKSITAGLLCSVGDYLAQQRDPTISKTNWKRLLRFSIKGLGGGIIWSFWYDKIDEIIDSSLLLLFDDSSPPPPESLSYNNDDDSSSMMMMTTTTTMMSIRTLTTTATTAAATAASNTIKVILSIVLEQFFWCPVVFGLWDIPVSTILNGGKIKSIPVDVKTNLGGLLIDNAKVWTLANVLIYNAPLEYRVGISNLVDIFWQSIVSDMAAKCGAAASTTTTTTTTSPVKDPGVAVVTGYLTTHQDVVAGTASLNNGGRRSKIIMSKREAERV